MLTFDGIASLQLQPLEGCPNLPAVQADLTGPTTIQVMPERVKKVREAAIRSMHLVGGGSPDPSESFFDISIMLDQTRESVVGQNPGPPNSFFDVFLILDLPDPANPSGPMLMLRSEAPVHLMATNGFPPNMNKGQFPLLETRFESNQPVVFFLPTPGPPEFPPNPCMELKQMSFVPVNPSSAIIKRELIQIEKTLDRLLRLRNPTVPPPTDGQTN
jgi:hypothetical protein